MFDNYNISLVFLSFGIALLASYTAVDLALRMKSATGIARKFWHVSASSALGIGVWGAHFIGILAFKLPVSDSYDIFLTGISILPAVLASMVVLWVMGRSDMRRPALFLSSVIMGAGISSMHYVGMLAMQIVPAIQYNELLLILSFVIAIIVSFVALSMALAISGMHYWYGAFAASVRYKRAAVRTY